VTSTNESDESLPGESVRQDGPFDDEPSDVDQYDGPLREDDSLDDENYDDEPYADERYPTQRRRWRVRRAVLLVIGLFLLVVIAASAWVLYTGLKARTELEAVRTGVSQLRSDIRDGNLSAAQADADSVREHADRAYDLTTGPVWAVAGNIPYLGDPMKTTRAVTASVHSIADGALPGLIAATHGFHSLRAPDGGFDVKSIAALGPALGRATVAMDDAAHTIATASDTTWLGSVNQARDDLLDQVTRLSTSIRSARLAVDIVPPMLGADGPRTYMITFENNAEMRGVGGLPGAFAILRADNGKLSFSQFGSNDSLQGTPSGLDFGSGFNTLWPGDPTNSYKNSDDSLNFPYAAQIWTAMWKRKTGQQLDGAIALDPRALSYLLDVTGPTFLPDHTKISGDNVVTLTQKEVYVRFAHDRQARKRYLDDIARVVAKKLVSTRHSPLDLLKAAGKGAQEQRVLLWARDQSVEKKLSSLPLAGVVPPTTAPYAGVAIVNTLGSKLDYYMHASLAYTRSGCGSTRSVTAKITITNNATSGLPSFVYGLIYRPGYPHHVGTNRLAVYYYASSGAKLTSITNGGAAVQPVLGSELGHPVVKVSLTIPKGATRTLELHLTEPSGTGPPTVRVPPMINPMTVDVTDADCGS
jgi:hypothetical protein